jgi:hypothetical protein
VGKAIGIIFIAFLLNFPCSPKVLWWALPIKSCSLDLNLFAQCPPYPLLTQFDLYYLRVLSIKKNLCIACLAVALTLNVNTGSANAQQFWNRFLAEIIQEVGSEAARQILLSMFGSSSDARSAESSQRSISCEVIDPTGTPLNVRSTPNGSSIVTRLTNGTTVIPYKVAYDEKNRHWILIGDAVHSWGWVFGPYVSCFFD